jgi:hypothetical protein
VSVADEISPTYYGEQRIALRTEAGVSVFRAGVPIVLTVDYSAAAPEGVVLPLELTITSLSGARTFQRRVFRRFAPGQVLVLPREGGPHLVRLAEAHHNRWFGALTLNVEGAVIDEALLLT